MIDVVYWKESLVNKESDSKILQCVTYFRLLFQASSAFIQTDWSMQLQYSILLNCSKSHHIISGEIQKRVNNVSSDFNCTFITR